jgi:hypothetical protein
MAAVFLATAAGWSACFICDLVALAIAYEAIWRMRRGLGARRLGVDYGIGPTTWAVPVPANLPYRAQETVEIQAHGSPHAASALLHGTLAGKACGALTLLATMAVVIDGAMDAKDRCGNPYRTTRRAPRSRPNVSSAVISAAEAEVTYKAARAGAVAVGGTSASLKSSTRGTPAGAGTFDIESDGVALTIQFVRGRAGDLAWKVDIRFQGDRAQGGEGNDRVSAFRAAAHRKPGPSDCGMPLPKATNWHAVEQVLTKAGAFRGKGGRP